MLDLTKVLLAILELAFTAALIYFIPYLKKLVREKTTAQQQAEIRMWVKIAVQAAEMIYNETDMGEIKFDYVVRFLEEKGFTLDVDEVKALIESAVLEMKNEILK